MTDERQVYDVEMEAAVLSALIAKPDTLDDVRGMLEPQDFFEFAHQRLLEAIYTLDESGSPFDIRTISVWLRERGWFDKIGVPRLFEILDACPAVANVKAYAEVVRDHARQRRMVSACREIAAAGLEPVENVSAWLQDAASRVFDLTQTVTEARTAETIGEIVPRVMRDVQERFNAGGKTPGLRTGWASLDRAIQGWVPGCSYVIAGRPGQGKSALALNTSVHVAKAGHAVVFVSAEMTRDQLVQRALAADSGQPITAVASGGLQKHHWGSFTEAATVLARLPLSIAYVPGATMGLVRSIVRREFSRLRHAHGAELKLGAIVVDYIQLLDGQRQRGETRETEVARISLELTRMAGEFGCAMLALSQLNRAHAGEPPKLEDLRESGAIEQDAYGVLGIYRKAVDVGGGRIELHRNAQVYVLKNRNGPLGTVELTFVDECVRFDERQDEYSGHWEDR